MMVPRAHHQLQGHPNNLEWSLCGERVKAETLQSKLENTNTTVKQTGAMPHQSG